VLPAPALLALDVEQLFGEVGSFHLAFPYSAFEVKRWQARRMPARTKRGPLRLTTLDFFDAFTWREPRSTSLENAMD
jgi:hypothetical protein